MSLRIPVEVYRGLRWKLEDFGAEAHLVLATLGPEEAEAARQLVKVGIVAEIARNPAPDRERQRLESVYLRIADRSDDARSALRGLDPAEAEAFRRVAIYAIRSIFDAKLDPAWGRIRGP